jgi:hypothetical protein
MPQEWAAEPRGARAVILDVWRTDDRLTAFLGERLPHRFRAAALPVASLGTIRMIAGGVHDARCRSIKTLRGEWTAPAAEAKS